MPEQLPLFAPSEEPAPVGPAPPDPKRESIARRLPAEIYLGTSSWAFPGWKGIVYDRDASTRVLSRHGLAAYSRNPLLRAVAIDRTYYGPISASEFRAYAEQVPPDFRFVVKAHELLLRRAFPGPERAWNELYLDRDHALKEVIEPCLEGLGGKAAVLLLQFPPQNVSRLGGPSRFASDLASFLSELPRELLYAVELRNRELLTPEYLDALESARAAHCFNVHPAMPDLTEQRERCRGRSFPSSVTRWMLRRDRGYEDAREDFHPFDRLVQEDSPARESIVAICRSAVASGKTAYVVVNNKAEGSAPLSVFRLAEELSRAPDHQAIP